MVAAPASLVLPLGPSVGSGIARRVGGQNVGGRSWQLGPITLSESLWLMDDKHVGPPPDTTAREVALGLARAGLSLVPAVGGAAAELLTLVVNPIIQGRRDRWLVSLAEAVDDLRAHGIDVRTLEGNEAVVSIILNATQAAARTHEEEKLDALRNGVVNAVLGVNYDEQMSQMFIRCIDELTPLHLRLLDYYRAPDEWFESRRMVVPDTFPLNAVIPELEHRPELYALLAQAENDLVARGLLNERRRSGRPQRVPYPLTTSLGDLFLGFVSRRQGGGVATADRDAEAT